MLEILYLTKTKRGLNWDFQYNIRSIFWTTIFNSTFYQFFIFLQILLWTCGQRYLYKINFWGFLLCLFWSKAWGSSKTSPPTFLKRSNMETFFLQRTLILKNWRPNTGQLKKIEALFIVEAEVNGSLPIAHY